MQTPVSVNENPRDWAQDVLLVIFVQEYDRYNVSVGLEGLTVGPSPEREGHRVRLPRLAATEMQVNLGVLSLRPVQDTGGESAVSWACSL